jgi:hypothetical protein
VTVEIRLNSRKHKGLIAIVDDIDGELSALKWHPTIGRQTTYAQRRPRFGENAIPLHRVVLERVLGRTLSKDEFADHINHNGLDNRRENLRLATRTENMRNKRRPRNNTSGYKGVCWDKKNSKWQVHIRVNSKQKLLGRFTDIKEAARIWNQAAIEAYGEFASLNVIPEDA